jgi:hypothetical protein
MQRRKRSPESDAEKGVDPKIVADLMGHDLDVNLNTYTQTSMDSRHEAVKTLETAFIN